MYERGFSSFGFLIALTASAMLISETVSSIWCIAVIILFSYWFGVNWVLLSKKLRS